MDEYDAIIIGAGVNGLTTAAYLSLAGLNVLLAERRWEVGGAAMTDEQSGVRFNTHAIYMMMMESMPITEDLNLETYGCRYIKPEKQIAVLTESKKDIILYSDLEKSVKSIENVSKKDAEIYRKMMNDFDRWVKEILIPQTYRPPYPFVDLSIKLSESELGKEFSEVADNTARGIIEDYGYETEALKTALLYLYTMWGLNPEESGIPATLTPLYINRMLDSTLIRGGTHRLPSAIHKVIYKNKGTVEENEEVDKILIEDGKAVGIRTIEGKEFRSKIVVSSVDPEQTFIRFIGEETLNKMDLSPLADIPKRWQWESSSLFLCHLATNCFPDFSLSGHEGVNDAMIQVMGVETMDDLVSEVYRVREGELAKSFHVTSPTQFDSSQTFSFIFRKAPKEVPGGRLEAVRLETIAPFQPAAGDWERLKNEYADQLIGTLQEYAPNMKTAKIVRRYPYPPTYIEEKFPNMKQGSIKHGEYVSLQMGYMRPGAECSEYRTPISGLYLCGSSSHPGGMIVLGPGYNAANAIVKDLGIKPPWITSDVRYKDIIDKGLCF
jgi:phytoene dehydrogenase-like protein